MNDELPADVRALFDAEQVAPVCTDAARLAIRGKLGATLGIAPVGAKLALLLKIVMLVLAIGGIAVVVLVASPDETPAPAPLVEHAIATAPTIDSIETSVVVVESLPALGPRPARVTPPVSRAVARPRPQHELLAEASRLLAQDPTRAMAALDEDAHLHPDGALSEERDALRISALRALHREADATAAARHFIERYPRSIHRQAAEAAIIDRESP